MLPMPIDGNRSVVRKWIDAAKTETEKARRESALAQFHGVVIVACHDAKRARVPLHVIEHLLCALGNNVKESKSDRKS